MSRARAPPRNSPLIQRRSFSSRLTTTFSVILDVNPPQSLTAKKAVPESKSPAPIWSSFSGSAFDFTGNCSVKAITVKTAGASYTNQVSSTMSKSTFTAILEREGDIYVGLCPELDIASQGATIEEATANLREAFALFLETADSQEITQRLRSGVFVTTFDVVDG
jgi:predicted RNase H-like HicB family nuclease